MNENANQGISPLGRLLSVGGFVAVCVMIFGFLWTNSGGRLPLVKDSSYQVTVTVPRVANLVYFSDVMVAGVKAGKIRKITEHGDHATALVELDPSVVPLHEKATVQVRAKTLIDESYLDVVDGSGKEVPDGGKLPASGGKAPVQLNDILAALDAPTREALGKTLRSAGLSTKDSKDEVAAAVSGLGQLGREGEDVLDALAGQSADLKHLTRSSTQVLAALATRRAQVSQLVTSADKVSQATAGQSGDVKKVLRALPPLLAAANESSGDLEKLAGSLAPVATNLDAASIDLSAALIELPATAKDLRGLIPALNGTIDEAPATLNKVPTLSNDVESFIPSASALLTDVNPMLGYLEPYGRDFAAFISNFGAALTRGDVNGKAVPVMPVINEQSVKGIPLDTNFGVLDKYNPLPRPGTGSEPGPTRRAYPRVEWEPAPK